MYVYYYVHIMGENAPGCQMRTVVSISIVMVATRIQHIITEFMKNIAQHISSLKKISIIVVGIMSRNKMPDDFTYLLSHECSFCL